MCIHEAINTPEQLQKFYNQPPRFALAMNTDFHTSARIHQVQLDQPDARASRG